jgi:hypothetical protein
MYGISVYSVLRSADIHGGRRHLVAGSNSGRVHFGRFPPLRTVARNKASVTA